MKLIDKAKVVAEISKRIKGINRLIDTDYNDKEKFSLESVLIERIHTYEDILSLLDTLEVKEVDLEKVFNDEYSQFSNDVDAMDYGFPIDLADYRDFAKHFFELGLKANCLITANDRGMAEEIIINLKRVEKDYRIDLTKEIEWLRNKTQKGDKE